MKTKKGAWVSGEEDEVILPRNTKWRVVSQRECEYQSKIYTGKTLSEKIIIFQLVEEEMLENV